MGGITPEFSQIVAKATMTVEKKKQIETEVNVATTKEGPKQTDTKLTEIVENLGKIDYKNMSSADFKYIGEHFKIFIQEASQEQVTEVLTKTGSYFGQDDKYVSEILAYMLQNEGKPLSKEYDKYLDEHPEFMEKYGITKDTHQFIDIEKTNKMLLTQARATASIEAVIELSKGRILTANDLQELLTEQAEIREAMRLTEDSPELNDQKWLDEQAKAFTSRYKINHEEILRGAVDAREVDNARKRSIETISPNIKVPNATTINARPDVAVDKGISVDAIEAGVAAWLETTQDWAQVYGKEAQESELRNHEEDNQNNFDDFINSNESFKNNYKNISKAELEPNSQDNTQEQVAEAIQAMQQATVAKEQVVKQDDYESPTFETERKGLRKLFGGIADFFSGKRKLGGNNQKVLNAGGDEKANTVYQEKPSKEGFNLADSTNGLVPTRVGIRNTLGNIGKSLMNLFSSNKKEPDVITNQATIVDENGTVSTPDIFAVSDEVKQATIEVSKKAAQVKAEQNKQPIIPTTKKIENAHQANDGPVIE